MIVPMKEDHVAQVAALEKRCFSDPWSEASIAEELRNPLSTWLVNEEDGIVTGYIGAQSVPPEADVMNLAVAPDCRRRGVGAKLLCTMAELLHSRGIVTLFLEVRPSNAAAIALYERYGFAQVGRRPKYYVNPPEDALILRKEL
ncbi:MAG: ribosomal protein S18-alanine N-acetyltransferase [Oscillospiraceae bacterium]|nr:ribosomal protein S18-alanine N-acetyltransferase [Oscillospiraceae bacterium]